MTRGKRLSDWHREGHAVRNREASRRPECVAESRRIGTPYGALGGQIDRALYLTDVPHLARCKRLQSLIFLGSLMKFVGWCPGKDSNLHGLHRWYLKPVRLPIPPPGHGALHSCGGGRMSMARLSGRAPVWRAVLGVWRGAIRADGRVTSGRRMALILLALRNPLAACDMPSFRPDGGALDGF